MRLKRAAAVLASVLFCPAVFLLLWLIYTTALPDGPVWIPGYPMVIALYFLVAGGIFQKKLGLRRITLWLWMLLPGYLLGCALLLLWQPELLQSGDILISLFQLLLLQTPVWLAVWLGLWIAGLVRSPEARERAKMRAKRSLNAACKDAVPCLAILMLLSAYLYLKVPPAETYQDEGVYTFTASSGYPTARVEYRYRRYYKRIERHVYVVVYKAPGGWRWEQDFLLESEGKEAIQNRDQVERRVLSIVGADHRYITVPSSFTAEQYVGKQRQIYLSICGVCLAAEGAVWFILRKRKKSVPGGNEMQTKE